MTHLVIWLLSQPLLWAGLGIILGSYFFWRGFRLLQRKRLIMDTPRSAIRSAALGRVEVSGKAIGPYTLVAPLSHSDCFYYRLAIESNPQGDLRKSIQEMCAPLFLDDGTGTLMIYPQGSELLLSPSSERSEYGKLALALTKYSGGDPRVCSGILHKARRYYFCAGQAPGKSMGEKGSDCRVHRVVSHRTRIYRLRRSRSAAPRSVPILESQSPRRIGRSVAQRVRFPSSRDPDAEQWAVYHFHG